MTNVNHGEKTYFVTSEFPRQIFSMESRRIFLNYNKKYLAGTHTRCNNVIDLYDLGFMMLFIIKIITGGSRGVRANCVPTVSPVVTVLDPPTISANDYYAYHVTLGMISERSTHLLSLGLKVKIAMDRTRTAMPQNTTARGTVMTTLRSVKK